MVEEQQTDLQKEGRSAEKNEVSVMELRQQKTRTKSAFTKARHSLLVSLADKEVKTDSVMYLCDLLNERQTEATDIMFLLTERYKAQKDGKNHEKVCEEIEQLETGVQQCAKEGARYYREQISLIYCKPASN